MSKKIYGIDLGTTNSVVAYGDELLTDLVASVADVKNRKAGNSLRRNFDYTLSRSFKTSISLGDEGIEPLEASSLVLQELVNQVKAKTGETMRDVVISVPAAFDSNERTATVKAASKIGLNVVSLVSEPTAAALQYNRGRRGLTVVYDLGGGTFDVSVIDNRSGYYMVKGTDGCKLGGSDLDNEIQKFVRIKSGMAKHRVKVSDLSLIVGICEDAKLEIQRTMKDVVIDMSHFEYCGSKPTVTLTVEEYVQLEGLVFNRTIEMTKEVIKNCICDGEKYRIVLVGGSTRCPFLRKIVEVALEHPIEKVTYNPDTIVAEGAGYFAKLKETDSINEMIQEITKGFGIQMEDGRIRPIIPPNSKIPTKGILRVKNAEDATGMQLRIYQGNDIIAKYNSYVGTMEFKYKEPMPAGEGEVFVQLVIDENGILQVIAREPLQEEQKVTLRFRGC